MKHTPCAALLAHQPGGRLLPVCLILVLLVTWLLPDTASASMPHEPSPTSPTLPQDLGWAGGFNAPGMDGPVQALVFGPDGSLYAGGDFTHAGEVAANSIAQWDSSTSSWRALGDGIRGDGSYVYALAFGPDDSLYVGGRFTVAGGLLVNDIARWDGSTSSWHPLGSGVGGTVGTPFVFALAVGPDGSLYAGGDFSTAGGVDSYSIARWDGSQWHPLGNGMNNSVYALAVGPDGAVYAGGRFTTAGGALANRIARWDGTQWHPLGSGIDGYTIRALTFGPDGSLYAAGEFGAAGGVEAHNIARWDPSTSSWHSLGGWIDGAIYSLAIGTDASLYAGGGFSTVSGVTASHIARWDGSEWHPLGTGIGPSDRTTSSVVLALALRENGLIYAGGEFTVAGGVAANRIADWNETTMLWQPLSSGNGMSSPVLSLALGPDGSLYAGGFFTTAGHVPANYIAHWDGSQWVPMAGGMDGMVNAVAIGLDGSLYAGGEFITAGSVPANYIARWDGTTASWRSLGTGLNWNVDALAFHPDGSLYAGGRFTTAGGAAANYVARWDGSQWHPLGSGIGGVEVPRIYALAVSPDGSLYAGGEFTTAGDVAANYIARWDGSQWHPLGSGIGGGCCPLVDALAFGPDRSLYVGGLFTTAGSVPTNFIARWDGSQWYALGSGMNGTALSLAFGPDGSLYAGGYFTAAGDVSAKYIARWDGSQWHPLGSGMNNDVRALGVAQDGQLYAGGYFTAAGGLSSSHIARWGEVIPTAVTLASFEALANYGSASTVWLVLAMFCLALTAGTTLARGRVRI